MRLNENSKKEVDPEARKKVKEFKSKKDVEKNCLLCSAFDIKCCSCSHSRWYLKFDWWIKQKI